MEGWQLVANALGTALAGAVFVDAGVRVARRHAWAGDRLALRVFASWWLLYGTLCLLRGLRFTLAAGGQMDVAAFMGVFYVEVVLAFLGLGGLSVYVVYLWRGKYLPLAWVYGAAGLVGIVVAVLTALHEPVQILHQEYRLDVRFVDPMPASVRWALLSSYYIPLVAIGGLFVHVAHVSQDVQRRRAYGFAAVLSLVALADAIDLGPTPLGPATLLAPAFRLMAAGSVVYTFLRRPT